MYATERKSQLWEPFISFRYKYFHHEAGQLRRRLVSQWLDGVVSDVGLTQEQLADRSGVARPTISRILNERADAEDETLERLARAMGLQADLLPVAHEGRGLAQPSERPDLGAFSRPAVREPGGEFYRPVGADSQLHTHDIFSLFATSPDEVVRKLDRMLEGGIGNEHIQAWLDDAEEIMGADGRRRFGKFIASLRARYPLPKREPPREGV